MDFVLAAVATTAATTGSGSWAVLLLYVGLALGVSFVCSVMEATLLSVTPGYIGALKQKKPKVGKRLEKFRADVDRPLAAILSFNTVAHTIGAAGAGAEAAMIFGSASMGLFGFILTLLILVCSEIIPKTVGAIYWRPLAPWVAWLCRPMIWLSTPLVWISQGFRWILARHHKEEPTSPEEIQALAELGHKGGVFDEGEAAILKNLMDVRSLRVRDIMTPRIVMKALSKETTVAETLAGYTKELKQFSRIPIYAENDDHVVGYVLSKDILWAAAEDEESRTLADIGREIAALPETTPLPLAYEKLIEAREHIALAVGQYGGTAGIVTMEDIMETILGREIIDEADSVHDMQMLARLNWEKRAKNIGLLAPMPNLSDLNIAENEE